MVFSDYFNFDFRFLYLSWDFKKDRIVFIVFYSRLKYSKKIGDIKRNYGVHFATKQFVYL